MSGSLAKLKKLTNKIHTIDETAPLSGKEIGEMLLAYLALMIHNAHALQGPPEGYAAAKIKLIDLSVTLSDNQMRIFNRYADLHNAVVRGQHEETLFVSQFFHAFYKLQGYQHDIINCEKRCKTAENRPLIITRNAYDELVKKAGSNDPQALIGLFDSSDPKQYILRCQIAGGGISVTEKGSPETGFTDGIYTADIDSLDTYDIDRFLDPKIDYYGDARYQIRCMFDAVCQIYLYNAHLKTAMDALKIDYMEDVFINTELVEYAVDQYNEYSEKAINDITGTAEDKEDRRTVLKEMFMPVKTARIREFADSTDKFKEIYEDMKDITGHGNYFDEAESIIPMIADSLRKEVFG